MRRRRRIANGRACRSSDRHRDAADRRRGCGEDVGVRIAVSAAPDYRWRHALSGANGAERKEGDVPLAG